MTNANWPNLVNQLLLTYLIFMALVYLASDYVIFPILGSSYNDEDLGVPVLKLPTEDGQQISAIYLSNPKAQYTLLISHGNGEDLGIILPMIKQFHDHGFAVLAYDYRGYGTSVGRPSEKKTYLDINAAFNYLTKTLKVTPKGIILYGRSLGSGPTLWLAEKNADIAAVIIESPMFTAFRVMSPIPVVPFDKYRNNQIIEKIQVPILIIHGQEDTIIPIWHGQKLYALAHSPKRFYVVEGAGHNDVMVIAGPHYWQVIQEFVSSIERQHP
jgi:pimeloyl-ACP methyl ester carboxylesterase